MATIEKLDSIAASKAAIKAAIQEKGVSCDDTLAEYANRIKAIPTGIPIVDVDAIFVPNNSQVITRPIWGLNETSDMMLIINIMDGGYCPFVVVVSMLRDDVGERSVISLTNENGDKYYLLQFNSFDYDNKTIIFDILSEEQPI